MSGQFGKTFGDKNFLDVKIVAGDEEFHCHRNILAGRSPVFKAMFLSEMIENTSRTVDIRDIRPEVAREMLQFIYSGSTKEDVLKEKSKELLAAAERYQ